MINTKEKYNEYLKAVDDVCMECALMSEEQCKKCPVQITVKQLEKCFEKHDKQYELLEEMLDKTEDAIVLAELSELF